MKKQRRTLANRHVDERGAVAILTAACLTALLIATAMVLDFGLARLDRQTNKALADSAALAGISAMGEELAAPVPWTGACTAVNYLKAEFAHLGVAGFTDSWKTGDGTAVTSPCSDSARLAALCTANAQPTWARYRGTVGPAANPRLIVEVKAGYDVTEEGFREETTYTNVGSDPGAATSGGCDQLAVIVTQARRPGLGSLATSSDIATTIRSVGRVEAGEFGKSPVALLILEQHDCAAIETNGSTTQLFVRGAGIRPGLIHSDSIGDTPGNAGNCNSKQIVGGTGSIKAFKATTGGAPGVIGIRALKPGEPGAVPSKAYDSPPAVVAEGAPGELPEGRPLVTRAPVDERYLAAVTGRINTAATKYSWDAVTAGASPNNYTVRTTCGGGSGLVDTITESKVFFDCPGGLTVDTATFTGSDTSVIVNGPVTIKTGGLLSMPNATEFVVKGPGTSSLTTPGFDNGGTFRLHDANAATCTLADSATSGRAEFVLGSGFFKQSNTNAVLRMCHTTMITMGNTTSMPTYSDPGATPTDNARNGHISVNGGAIDWTAPNARIGTPATTSDWAQFEDLAFWTETSESSSIGGNGLMHLSGVFMLPNANPFNIGGTGTQEVENSQYIARKLRANGGGTLTMAPDPNDAVTIEYFGDFVLVR